MQYYELDKEEQEIADAFEKGEVKRIKNFAQEKKKLQQAAGFTLDRTKNINIRVSEKDLQKMKALAVERGLTYKALISSLVHQYSSRKI